MAKTKALISCAVTAQLICGFVLAYANSQFTHNEAHFRQSGNLTLCQVMRKGTFMFYTCDQQILRRACASINLFSSFVVALLTINQLILDKGCRQTKYLKLVSHWDATISRLVGDKGLRYKRDFLPFFTLRSHWAL